MTSKSKMTKGFVGTKHLISAWTKGTRLTLQGLRLLTISLAVLFPATVAFALAVSFSPATNFLVGGVHTGSMAFGDLNGDGNPDLARANIFGHQIPQAQVVSNPSCGDILTSNTTLAGDLDCSSYSDGPALTLGADNITLDLGGYTIFGNSTGAATGQEGVSVNGFDGDIIKNGKILDGRSGVFLVGTTGTIISGVDLSASGGSQRGSGVLLSFATNAGTTISSVTINKRLIGVNVQDISTPSLKIQSSNFNGDDLGIYFNSPATDLTLTDNTVSNGTNFSLLLASLATFLKVANNDFSNNNYGGISFVGTADLTITPAMFNVEGTMGRALQFDGTNRMKIQDMNLSAVGPRSGLGILLASPNTDLTLTGLTITNRVHGMNVQTEDPGLSFVHNNLFGNSLSFYGNNAFTLDKGSKGNYWGHSCPVLFTAGVDSSRSDIVDNYPYSARNAWLNGGIPGSAGCGSTPDTDGDGINDDADQCLSTPGTSAFKGCPAGLRVSVGEVVSGSKQMDTALQAKVFSAANGSCAANIGVQPQNYDRIYTNCTAENTQNETLSPNDGNKPRNLISDLVGMGVTTGSKEIIVRSRQNADGSYGYMGFDLPNMLSGQSRDVGFNIVPGKTTYVQTSFFTQNSNGVWQSERRNQVIK